MSNFLDLVVLDEATQTRQFGSVGRARPVRPEQIRAVVTQVMLGSGRVNSAGHADAGETLMFTRMLEEFYAGVIMMPYPDVKGLGLFPVRGGSRIAEAFTYRQYDGVGESTPVSTSENADDYPIVNANGQETSTKARTWGNSYVVTMDQLERAASEGIPLENTMANLAKELHARRVDQLMATGNSTLGLEGITTNSNVLAVSRASSTLWAAAAVTADEIYADIKKLHDQVLINSYGIHKPDTLIMSLAMFLRAGDIRFSGFSSETPLDRARTTLGLKVDWWNALATADSASKDLMMCYESKPVNAEFILPIPFEQSAPQQQAFAFRTFCRMRAGGFQIRFPKAYAKMSACYAT